MTGTTFDSLIEETQQLLRSYVRNQEVATYLTTGVTDKATTFTVHEPRVLSRGLVEIDSELVLVESIDEQSKTFIVPPFGRGMEASAPAAHEPGARVTVNPLYPRSAVAAALNQTISGLGSQLYGIETVTFPASPTRVSYELPADTQRILSVSWVLRRTATRDRIYADNWVFDQQAEWPSGKGILMYEWPLPGDPITVVVGVPPTPLEVGQDFTDSKLPQSVYDVIMLGAASRLISQAGTGAIAATAVGAQTTLGTQQDPTTSIQLGRYIYAEYQTRLEQEIAAQQRTYSNRLHYTRRR